MPSTKTCIALILAAVGLGSGDGRDALAETKGIDRLHRMLGDGAVAAPLQVRRPRPKPIRRDPRNFTNETAAVSADPAITPDGRFVVFTNSDNIDNRIDDAVLERPGSNPDIFRIDFESLVPDETGAVVRVSVDVVDGRLDLLRATDGSVAESVTPAISADGRLVAFATNGVFSDPGLQGRDTNDSGDVYLKNLDEPGRVTLVSAEGANAPAAGGVPLGELGSVAMSDNGRFVAFVTSAPLDAVGNAIDDNGELDLYVRDVTADRLFLASLDVGDPRNRADDRAGGVLDPESFPFFLLTQPLAIDMSADGRFVAFTTAAALDPIDDNGEADVYLWRRLRPLSAPFLASRTAMGGVPELPPELSDLEDPPPLSSNPALSADGRFVLFESNAKLVGNDTNGLSDIYRFDRRAKSVAKSVVRFSVDSAGRQTAVRGSFDPAISGNGRFIAFTSNASDLVLDDTSFATEDPGGAGTVDIQAGDVFVKNVQSGAVTRASIDAEGEQADDGSESFSPALSADGSLIVFLSNAENVLGGSLDMDPSDPNIPLSGDTAVRTDVIFDLPPPPT